MGGGGCCGGKHEEEEDECAAGPRGLRLWATPPGSLDDVRAACHDKGYSLLAIEDPFLFDDVIHTLREEMREFCCCCCCYRRVCVGLLGNRTAKEETGKHTSLPKASSPYCLRAQSSCPEEAPESFFPVPAFVVLLTIYSA